MPIFKSGEGFAPSWCDLEYFEILRLGVGAACEFTRRGGKERLIVGRGACALRANGKDRTLREGDVVDLPHDARDIRISDVTEEAVLVRVSGHWGDETGSCGVFTLSPSLHPSNSGDPTSYTRNTEFDNHYHDFDEYWIIFAGRGEVVTEGRRYEVHAGDCVATGKGHHHDFPWVHETVRGVWFETSLQGARRLGHLWEHTHGTAQPEVSRI